VTFDFTAKVEHLLQHQSLLPELERLGCLFIVSALESLSNLVLRELDKGHTREDAIEALGLVRGAGIALRPTWVSFTPWTTLRDYLDVLEWVEEEDLVDHVDPVQFTVRLLVPPGSMLLERASIQPFLEPLAPEAFTYPWRHPDPTMDALHTEMSRLVEGATSSNEDLLVTFNRICDLAWSTGGEAPRPRLPSPAQRARAPRLTEAWFC
jgi:hypothetical protein